jgi:hypothetical protein
MRKDLKLYSAIRNAFAHARVHVDFNTDEVQTACRGLATYKFKAPKQEPLESRATYHLCTILFSLILSGAYGLTVPSYASAAYFSLYEEPMPLPNK